MSSVGSTSYADLAAKAITVTTRAFVAASVPAYLFFKYNSALTLSLTPAGILIPASIAVISTPSTLYCALGAIEAFVRTCGLGVNYLVRENRDYRWDQLSKEATTLHGLMRGALSPVSGYAIMHREWKKLGSGQDEGTPRVLKEEYYVYSVPRSIGQGIVDAGKWCLQKVKLGYNYSVATISWGFGKIWDGICWLTNTAIDGVKWGWRSSQPLRQLIKDFVVAVMVWSANRIVDLWNITRPLRQLVKWVVWDFALKTLVWELLLKTVIFDWILTKFVFNFLIEIIFSKVVWPLVWDLLLKTVIGDWILTKFVFNFLIQTLVWPIFKFIGFIVGGIISVAFGAIAWATRQAFGGR